MRGNRTQQDETMMDLETQDEEEAEQSNGRVSGWQSGPADP